MTRLLNALERRWARITRKYDAGHHRPSTNYRHAAVTTRKAKP